MQEIKKKIAKAIVLKTGLDTAIIEKLIETPPGKDLGDFSFPCFPLSKTTGKAPEMIAAELKADITKPDEIIQIETAGAYLNFYCDRAALLSLF
jgi:arginyl-tRNA synthetase